MKRDDLIDIYHAENGYEYIVEEVPENSLLASLGIYKNSIVKKNYRYKFGGPVVMRVSSRDIAIGKDVAEGIKVRKVAH